MNNPNKVFLSKNLKDQLIFYSGKRLLDEFATRYDKHLPKSIIKKFKGLMRELEFK